MSKFLDSLKALLTNIKDWVKRFIIAFKMNGEVKKKTILIGGIAIIVVLGVVLACMFIPSGTKEVEEEITTETDVPRIEPDPVVEPTDFLDVLEKYEDVYAWIEIPGTKNALQIDEDLSYPVAQHPEERDYYLYRDLDGNKTKEGTLFTEKECEGKPINSLEFDDPVTIIYGHNMANRSMFGGLQTYASKMDFSEEHYIYIYQEGRRITYLIVGGVQYETSHILYYHNTLSKAGAEEYKNANGLTDEQLLVEQEKDWDAFFDALLADTDSYTNIDKDNWVEFGDKVLILSVCKNGDDNHRYLVVAKMIEDTDDPTTWKIDEAALTEKKK